MGHLGLELFKRRATTTQYQRLLSTNSYNTRKDMSWKWIIITPHISRLVCLPHTYDLGIHSSNDPGLIFPIKKKLSSHTRKDCRLKSRRHIRNHWIFFEKCSNIFRKKFHHFFADWFCGLWDDSMNCCWNSDDKRLLFYYWLDYKENKFGTNRITLYSSLYIYTKGCMINIPTLLSVTSSFIICIVSSCAAWIVIFLR